MSPQNSTLGLIGGDFQYSTVRSGFRSGMYRPEDNAYIRNYAEMVDNFFYTGNVSTYPGYYPPESLSGIFVDPSLQRLFSCGGYTEEMTNVTSTDNSIYFNLFSEEGNVSSLGATSKKSLSWITGSFNNTISWYPNQSGLSLKPDGTQLIMCGNLVSTTSSFTTQYRGPIIIQYSLSNPWDITSINGSSTWNYGGTNYNIYTTGLGSIFFYAPQKSYNFGTSSTTKIQDIFVHPDGFIFYYLRDNIIYQGSISSAWDIGANGANLNVHTEFTIDPNLVTSLAITSYFSGFTFNATGTKLYVISSSEYVVSNQNRSGATIFQYNLSTPWSISTASFKTFLTVSGFDGEMSGRAQGLLMFPNGETMLCASNYYLSPRLYEYKILPY